MKSLLSLPFVLHAHLHLPLFFFFYILVSLMDEGDFKFQKPHNWISFTAKLFSILWVRPSIDFWKIIIVILFSFFPFNWFFPCIRTDWKNIRKVLEFLQLEFFFRIFWKIFLTVIDLTYYSFIITTGSVPTIWH